MTRPRPLPTRSRTIIQRRTRRVLAALTLVGALVVGSVDVFLLTQARTSTQVGLDQVLQDFREQEPSNDAASRPGPSATTGTQGRDPALPADTQTAPATEPTEVTQDVTADEPTAGAGAPPTSDPARQPEPTTTAAPQTEPSPQDDVPATPQLSLPTPGVYEYETDGYETVSFGGGRHDYPERTYASVRHDGGCEYTVEHRWVEEHAEQHHRCNQGTDLLGLWTTAQVTFFGQTERTEVQCDPPVLVLRLTDEPGTAREFACDGGDTTTHETVTYLGEETMVVGGVEVTAKHILAEGRVEGRSNGTTRHERWLHPEDGTVLRGIRHVDTRSDAFGTSVRYVENVEYTLVSLTPRR